MLEYYFTNRINGHWVLDITSIYTAMFDVSFKVYLICV